MGPVEAALRECPGCGLFQIEPELAPGTTAHCERCGTALRKARRHPLEHSLALAVAALILLGVMCATTLMTVSTSGIVHGAGIFSGPLELEQRGMTSLAVVVVFVTVAAPLAKLLGTIYVLLRIREAKPPPHLRRIFVWVERLTTWSMVEVFVLGVFVAYVKLGDLVKIELNAGVYALLALTVVIVWADGALDREAIWDAFDSGRARNLSRMALATGQVPPGAIGCETCTLVAEPDDKRARVPALRFSAACPKTGQPREDMGIGRCRRGGLYTSEFVSGPHGDAARLRATEHNTGRRAGIDPLEDVPAGRVGVLCQYRRSDAEDGRPYLDVGFCANRAHKVASRSNPALLHHTLDRSLVDDRHLHGGSARRSCSIRRVRHH